MVRKVPAYRLPAVAQTLGAPSNGKGSAFTNAGRGVTKRGIRRRIYAGIGIAGVLIGAAGVGVFVFLADIGNFLRPFLPFLPIWKAF